MIMDVKNMSALQLLRTYNIEVWEGEEQNKIYDFTEDKVYQSPIEWANATVEDDNDDDYDYSDPHKSGYDTNGGDYY